jgi:hypothetical protein
MDLGKVPISIVRWLNGIADRREMSKIKMLALQKQGSSINENKGLLT